ncbi:MAG TPA: nucleotide exchange factor GrpE [Acidimicrobiales bacterium]|nr:nucleotide exchange factor GrpE [Acidimicrobiales bacterium]
MTQHDPEFFDDGSFDEILDAEITAAEFFNTVDEDSTEGSDSAVSVIATEAILPDVAALQKERDEYLSALQRVQADFENYRKRVLRQQDEQSARAALGLVEKLLPVLDSLDLAVAHIEKSGVDVAASPEAHALVHARSLLNETLAKDGLERVDASGAVFDPSIHDAVARTEAEAAGDPNAPAAETTIEEVLRAGYRWRGQVLRPAMVRVRG